MDKLLKRYLKQDIIVTSFLSRDGAGDATYAAPVTVKGFLTGKTTVLISPAGVQRVSSQVIYFDEITGPTIKHEDQLTLPDGREFTVTDYKPYYNGKGEFDYVEVYL